MSTSEAIRVAAESIASAEGLYIGAGAGMGADSGLPTFRGRDGFWRAYPPYRDLGLSFEDLASPGLFARDPALAWGFYGHRLHLYRGTRPHEGFSVLRTWAEAMPLGAFALTSNVDGHFQRSGFDSNVNEVHGSIHHLQCARPCCDRVWGADGVEIDVDPATFRAREPLPRCPACGGMARPNILMFGDWAWVEHRAAEQDERRAAWVRGAVGRRVAVVELGAGTAIPTVRFNCERVAQELGARLIRVNPDEPGGPAGSVCLAAGALEVLRLLREGIGR